MNITRHLTPLLAALLLLLAPYASALELGEAKDRGLVGETATGYVAAVKSSADVDALVTDINKRRKVQYQKIADENNISREAVEARAGQVAIEKTPAGQMVDPGSGWQKK